MRLLYLTLFIIILDFEIQTFADEIIQDINGNYFLIKNDGTFIKLPPPKPGNKYIIKKKVIKKKINEDKIFKRSKKKARKRTNQGFR